MADGTNRFPLDNVDSFRGPTASQSAGLTLAAAKAMMKAAIGLAQDKAWTALMNRMPTRDLAPLVQPGAEFYGYESIGRGRTIVFAGGMPLLRDGVLVGGVGVSGGSIEEDQAAAAAAVAAFG
ncbi:MAG: hypothetical protein QOI92_2760 [Chloroflexota bacterium]|jgi:uncharacterized protein GlcG (DUF336 family)|nr:hypothetical protein [Chloroflexota bacterium]